MYQATGSPNPRQVMRAVTKAVYDSEFGKKSRQKVREEVDRMEQILAEQNREEVQNIAMAPPFSIKR